MNNNINKSSSLNNSINSGVQEDVSNTETILTSSINNSIISNTTRNDTYNMNNNIQELSLNAPISLNGISYDSVTDEELLDIWETEIDMRKRDVIIRELKKRDLFPSIALQKFHDETGAYPNTEDPDFLAKLLVRREIAESKQTGWQSETNPCDALEFEITPVQRFCANFMSPRTPYQSALLYHGVGVGKTCAAVQIAENWLEIYPRKKVYIIAPVTIQAGFENTIFNTNRVNIGVGNTPNTASQCTGTKYMELTGSLMEKDPEVIRKKTASARKSRYTITGYRRFANMIKSLLKRIPASYTGDKRIQEEAKIIRREFSGRLLIIDEAHNLRDVGASIPEEDEEESPGGQNDKDDMGAGKALTPYLDKVLTYAEGLKLVLLTATPMYNSYREIIHICNLLLKNDKKATIRETDIFDEAGRILDGAEEIIGSISQKYVSFMRGENPQSFPIRLKSIEAEETIAYSGYNPLGKEVDINETDYINNLPIFKTEISQEALRAYHALSTNMPVGKDPSVFQLDALLQPCNIIFPPLDEEDADEDLNKRVGADALKLHFDFEKNKYNEYQYKSINKDGASWLALGNLQRYSTKFAHIIELMQKAKGVCFAYTRFVLAGAIPFALAMEANGYTPYGRKSMLLGDGIQVEGGRQCAYCKNKEKMHVGQDHTFVPAKYVLLTGNKLISPYNAKMIEAEKDPANKNGGIIKVVIGSEVASEGVDLKYIREIHIIDPWKHLNKTEQIIGRGIRFCSHTLLPPEERNTIIYLHAASFPEDMDTESPDLYSYRYSYRKAKLGGAVSRIMKQYAIDCNLNIEAILIESNEIFKHKDAQGQLRDVNISDNPFTAVCDWLDTCDYRCVPTIDVDVYKSDDKGYDEFSGRWRDAELKKRLKYAFEKQPFYSSDDLFLSIFEDIPRPTVVELFLSVLNNKTFRVFNKEREGYITYRNGLYLFQPLELEDTAIPISLRVSMFPVKRDIYTPMMIQMQKTALPTALSRKTMVTSTKAVAAKSAAAAFDSNSESNNSIDSQVDSINAAVSVNEAVGLEDMTAAVSSADSVDVSDLIDAWESYSDWLDIILSKNKKASIRALTLTTVGETDRFLDFLQDKMQKDPTKLNKAIETFEIILWLAESMLPWTEESQSTFKQVCLEILWDEYFTDMDKQRILMLPKVPDAFESVIDEHYLRYNGREVVRLVQTSTSSLKYICDKKECSQAVIDYITTEEGIDTLKDLEINKKTTGELYGFLAIKDNDHVIFKSNGFIKSKPGSGQECAILSGTQGHINKLVQVGDILEENGYDNLGLTNDIIAGTRKIKNAHRLCMLLDLVLRYIDAVAVNNRRWFYRQIASALTHNIAGKGKKK